MNLNSLQKLMSASPQSRVIKKYMADILKNEYKNHEDIVERISASLITDSDLGAFTNLVAAIYSEAYGKCVEDHRVRLKELGIESTIKAQK